MEKIRFTVELSIDLHNQLKSLQAHWGMVHTSEVIRRMIKDAVRINRPPCLKKTERETK